MAESVIKDVSYSAQLGDDGQIELTIEVERISFVKEVIPDGQLAGMMGHRQVPSTDTRTFSLHPTQARALWEQMGRALEEQRLRGY